MTFSKLDQNYTHQSHPTSTPFAPELAPKTNPQITEQLGCPGSLHELHTQPVITDKHKSYSPCDMFFADMGAVLHIVSLLHSSLAAGKRSLQVCRLSTDRAAPNAKNNNHVGAEVRSCVKVEVDAFGLPSLINLRFLWT